MKHGNSKLEFNLVAEGIRKIALLWQLMKNGTLEEGAILFWDEPEANINPINIPLALQDGRRSEVRDQRTIQESGEEYEKRYVYSAL